MHPLSFKHSTVHYTKKLSASAPVESRNVHLLVLVLCPSLHSVIGTCWSLWRSWFCVMCQLEKWCSTTWFSPCPSFVLQCEQDRALTLWPHTHWHSWVCGEQGMVVWSLGVQTECKTCEIKVKPAQACSWVSKTWDNMRGRSEHHAVRAVNWGCHQHAYTGQMGNNWRFQRVPGGRELNLGRVGGTKGDILKVYACKRARQCNVWPLQAQAHRDQTEQTHTTHTHTNTHKTHTKHTHTQTHTHTRTNTHTHTLTLTPAHQHTNTHTHTQSHTHTCTHAHTLTHTHNTHTHTLCVVRGDLPTTPMLAACCCCSRYVGSWNKGANGLCVWSVC